jgi:predicted phage terminase large subunit-like protein
MTPLDEERALLLASPLLFIKTFYKLRTGREFILSEPVGRESHYITICRELKKAFNLETKNLLINVPPGHGKSELLKGFVAWAMAHYPDSQFLYISYSHDLAAKHTYGIKQIMSLPYYKKLFGVEIKHDSSAKDNFQTIQGGTVAAFGSLGSITGRDGGLPNLDRFSGAIIIDDIIKPSDAHSDTARENTFKNYMETIQTRRRGPNVPMIFLGQCTHEDDPSMRIRAGIDGLDWMHIVLPARDDLKNILAPNLTTKEFLDNMEQFSPYAYAAQYQQNPQPAGGGIFNPEWLIELDEEPKILATFITGDTSETDKTYNDATVFSFWGIYYIEEMNIPTKKIGLHWIDCLELRVEPKDLEAEFRQFYAQCLCYPVQPQFAAIEKKSTGVTLLSVLQDFRGLQIMDIERTRASGNKIARFLNCQPYVASKQISLPRHGKHNQLVKEHLRKITLNNSHRFDDIADTLADAVQITFIDGYVPRRTLTGENVEQSDIVSQLAQSFKQISDLKEKSYAKRRF